MTAMDDIQPEDIWGPTPRSQSEVDNTTINDRLHFATQLLSRIDNAIITKQEQRQLLEEINGHVDVLQHGLTDENGKVLLSAPCTEIGSAEQQKILMRIVRQSNAVREQLTPGLSDANDDRQVPTN